MATGALLSAAVIRMAPNPPNWAAQQHAAAPVASLVKTINLVLSGIYSVHGTVKVGGTPEIPVSRVVSLIDVKSGRISRRALSTSDGNYGFMFVPRGPWMVIANDYTGEYNAVIADNILGVPM